MQYKYAEIGDTVYFWFAFNDVNGNAVDGATPLYDVRLAGAAASAAPTASGTPTLLSHASYGPGLFEIAIDTTSLAVGEYAVFCTLTISGVNPAGFCGSFKLRTYGTVEDAEPTLSGADADSFLYRAIQRVRLLTDEPEVNAKYPDSTILNMLQEAHVQILQEAQRSCNQPLTATYTFTYSSSVTSYVLPSTVGRVLFIGETSTSGFRTLYTSRSRLNSYGRGVWVEGNLVKFQGTNCLTNGATVTVEYAPDGCAKLYTSSTTTFTTTTLTGAAALLGTRDTRANAYLGSILRVLPSTDNPVEQERIITAQSGTTYEIYTVGEAFSPALSGTVFFEVDPPFGNGFDLVLATQVAMIICGNEGNDTRRRTLEKNFLHQIRSLVLSQANRDGVMGSKVRTDGALGPRGSRYRNGIVY